MTHRRRDPPCPARSRRRVQGCPTALRIPHCDGSIEGCTHETVLHAAAHALRILPKKGGRKFQPGDSAVNFRRLRQLARLDDGRVDRMQRVHVCNDRGRGGGVQSSTRGGRVKVPCLIRGRTCVALLARGRERGLLTHERSELFDPDRYASVAIVDLEDLGERALRHAHAERAERREQPVGVGDGRRPVGSRGGVCDPASSSGSVRSELAHAARYASIRATHSSALASSSA